MKIQQLSLFLLVFSFLFSIYNVKSYNYQPQTYTIYTNKDLESLYAPIILTPSGIRDFLRNTFSNSEYAQEVLPHCFSHLLQLLEYGNGSRKKRTYAKSVLRLFTNKLKACPYINAYAFSDMLNDMNELLVPQIYPVYRSEEERSKVVYNLMYSSFTTDFVSFKENPRLFLDDLSYQIVERVNDWYIPDTDIEQVRSLAIRFLEIGLNKVIWHPQDYEETWESVKTISDNLAAFVESGIISDIEDLNDLYVSLLERYIVFLDISSVDLPASFYRSVKEDIINSPDLLLLDLEEQEECLERKIDLLIRAFNSGEAKARSREFTIHVSN